jgi:hypothetical protein
VYEQTIFVCRFMNSTTKFEQKNMTFLILRIKELNSDTPIGKLCIASTTLSWIQIWHLWSLYTSCITYNKAIDSPPIVEHFPWIHEVSVVTNCPVWSRIHQPALVFPTPLWNPASTLHLYHPQFGFCHCVSCCYCCSVSSDMLFLSFCTAFHSFHMPSALAPGCCLQFLHIIPNTYFYYSTTPTPTLQTFPQHLYTHNDKYSW